MGIPNNGTVSVDIIKWHQVSINSPVAPNADLAEAMKGIRALAPNSPDIAVAIDSNQSLVDNYVKVKNI